MPHPSEGTPNFFFKDTATTEIYTLSLHDALPISGSYGWLAPKEDLGSPALPSIVECKSNRPAYLGTLHPLSSPIPTYPYHKHSRSSSSYFPAAFVPPSTTPPPHAITPATARHVSA